MNITLTYNFPKTFCKLFNAFREGVPCRLIEINRKFKETWFLCALLIETTSTSESSLRIRQITWHHISKHIFVVTTVGTQNVITDVFYIYRMHI